MSICKVKVPTSEALLSRDVPVGGGVAAQLSRELAEIASS